MGKGQVVPVDRLVDALWPDTPTRRALASLHPCLSHLRRVLEPGRPPRSASELLVSLPPGYAVRLPVEAVDAWRFEAAVREARNAPPAAAHRRLTEALGWWRGPAYQEWADQDWAVTEIARLRELRAVAGESAVATGLRAGLPAEVLPTAEELVHADPLREEGWRLLALAQWATGRQADALLTLRRAAAVIAEELGLDPGPRLAELEQAVLNGRFDVLRRDVPEQLDVSPAPAPVPVARAAVVPRPRAALETGRGAATTLAVPDARGPLDTLPGAAPHTPPPAGPDPARLVGRAEQTALLAAALEGARSGAGGTAVLLRGEAGIGKSALLEWTAGRAERAGFTVLRAVGSEAEREYAFSGLHQVLWPLLERTHDLPPHQREVLEHALGVRPGAPPGGLTVGAAALALLAAAARARPLLVLVDDLHWVDSSSVAVFAFLHRRVAALPVVIASASRPEDSTVEAWSMQPVEVGALSSAEAGELLELRHPGLAAVAAARLLADAGGNPLALVELPRQLRPGQLRGIDPLPDHLPLGQRLDRLFGDRLAGLTPAAERVLLLAALAGSGTAEGTASWLRAAAGEDAESVLETLEATGLARLDPVGRLAFRHPLVRRGVISRASGPRRREAHRLLAGCLAADDPRRLVHEAGAALLPDADLAARLQEAGHRLVRRGGDAEAALLLDRSAALTADPADRARRLTWAAVAAARGGQLRHTARLVEEIGRGPVPADIAPLFSYAVVYVDQSHRVEFGSSVELLPGPVEALTRPGAESFGGLAEQAYFKLLLAAVYTGDARAWQVLQDHRPHVSPLARLCHRAWSDPARTAHGVPGLLTALLDGLDRGQEAGAAWLLLWTAAAVDAADGPLRRRFAAQHGYATRGSVAKAEVYRAYLRGRWDEAPGCLHEAEAAEELGYHCNALLFRHYHAHFLAGRGDEAGLHAAEERIRPVATRAGMRFVTDQLDHLRALAALAHGRDEEAYHRLTSLMRPGELPPGLPWFHLPFLDLVEAAVRTGRRAEAAAHVAAGEAARIGEISAHHAFLLAAAAALAADDRQADARFAAAYAVPGARGWVFPYARLRLADGLRLRALGRPGAGEALREARRAFEELGAEPWARRCADQTGGGIPRQAGGPGAGEPFRRPPTGQELRVARPAATGLGTVGPAGRFAGQPSVVRGAAQPGAC
ncbi:BTAD domain-containing putative transcriptional regulator [Kitasatospora sp. NPDC090091]|uniref:BTAD domain-containing putative transcriptional regulator n=1 Tax=Kitasatospora sp. NPDC090091 TaxID=3364081 RepID=UPI00381AA820